MLFLYWKVIQVFFELSKMSDLLGWKKKLFKVLHAISKVIQVIFHMEKKVILGLKIIPALFVAILYKVKVI